MARQRLNPCAARPTGIAAAIIMALLSACSPSPNKSEQNRRSGNPAVQARANEAAQLARKAQAKDGALLFVRLAQNACRELNRKTEALNADSTLDFSELDSFIPSDLYPTDSFTIYVNAGTLAGLKTQLSQLVGSVVDLLRTLERSQATSTVRIDKQPDDAIGYRAAFQEKKLKTLASTDAYCESVRAAGAGVSSLR